jgi:molecular chaperone DnaK (HSP70)
MTARFSIGIDLGTTSAALAFVPLAVDAPAEVLAVAQLEAPDTLVEASTLPSFLYLAEEVLAEQLRGRATETNGWIVGLLARRRAGEMPGRVVRSAKSWLCHHAADRSAPILPWGSEDLLPTQKISPIQAGALILNYLQTAWDSRFAASGHRFREQEITITVPASFDAAAQRLTLDAAKAAGFPDGVHLLEEPQAAFYCWLERHSPANSLGEAAGPRHVLVIDVGGGTSDFSLFELRASVSGGTPGITRVAVSDHILLGGDNIDLALAVRLEQRLAGERGRISGPQWDHLVAACRDVKERALSGMASSDEPFTVALPGRGSGLIAGAQTAILTREEVERLVLDGFFPACDAHARPYRPQAGLRDWGLPYAADSAVTRYLADFLRDRPRAGAVLFNGGSLRPAVLRQRLLDQIAVWQDGSRPVELANEVPDLAVALGAARFGKLLHNHSARIAAGSARAVFLEAGTAATSEGALVCVLPRDAQVEQVFDIDVPGMEARTDQLVSFQACSSTRHRRCKAGDILPWDEGYQRLPLLQTIIRTAGGAAGEPGRTVPVRLAAKINALGLLQLSCVSTDPETPQSWPLEFNLRPHEQGGMEAPASVAPNAVPDAQQAAQDCLKTIFSRPPKSGRLTANVILKQLESSIGLPRHEWNAALLRNLWPALNERMTGRKLSVEHEEAWLMLAGFLLRPGFGFAHDGFRIDELWRLREAGLCFPGKRNKAQEHILWRRVAGGLSAERQTMLLAGELDSIKKARASPELIRLTGSLERLPRETKEQLIQTFINRVLELSEAKQHCAPYLAALGLLLNRAPFYAGPEAVVAPEFVARAYAVFQRLDWTETMLLEMHNLFLRAGRVVDDRNLDVPKSLRNEIAHKLERAGLAPTRTVTIKAFMPLARVDRTSLYGEALPPGLVLEVNLDGEEQHAEV